ncbi:MAG: c-type cytochrome, partial [Acetobacter sp.]|nr:c-type cytochrome [Acetobacter sp.]
TGAIAEYEKTLITPNSPFDAYLKGDEKAISPEAKRGYELFKDLGCASCHNGIGVGGGGYEIMGLEGNYFKDRGGPFTAADKGRYTVTGKPLDMSRFVVPNLRNVALTAPYFHDGSVKTLDEAVRKMARYQLGMDHLSDQDVTDIVAFLKSLTGQYQGHSIADLPKAVQQGTSQQPVHQQVMNQPENAHTK